MCVRMEFAQVHVVPPPSKLDSKLQLTSQLPMEARYSRAVAVVHVCTYDAIADTHISI